MPKSTYKGYKLFWEESRYYVNNRIALKAYDCDDGIPFLVASVNLPTEKIEPDEIAIKDYSENSGVLQHLIDLGVISEPIRYANNGHVEIPICKYLGLKHLPI